MPAGGYGWAPGGGARAGYALPLLSAFLLVLSFPPFHLLLPPFLALVPYAIYVADQPADRAGAYRALKGGFALGCVFFGALLHWILLALLPTASLAVPAYLAVALVLASFVAGGGWALHRLHRAAGLPLGVALPLAWTAVEWARGSLPFGLAFPWLGLGTSLTGFPELVGFAELVGARGVTFWLACIAGVIADLVLRAREGGRRGSRFRSGMASTGTIAVLLAILVVAPALWGAWRAETLVLREVATVAVLQTNLSMDAKDDPVRAAETALAVVEAERESLAAAAPDLLALPETAVPLRLEGAAGAEILARVQRLARAIGAPILVGTHGNGTDDAVRFNSALLVDEGGPTGYRYDKNLLVPLVERGPGGVAAGRGRPLGRVANGARFGVLVCYESAFPGAARADRRSGADVIVNVTNDAWYGAARPVLAAGAWQHRAHLVMRAIETRTGVARAANGGFSGFVDPVGRGYGAPPLFRDTTVAAPVYTADVRTLYTRTGDWVGPGAAAAVFVLLAGTAARRRRRIG